MGAPQYQNPHPVSEMGPLFTSGQKFWRGNIRTAPVALTNTANTGATGSAVADDKGNLSFGTGVVDTRLNFLYNPSDITVSYSAQSDQYAKPDRDNEVAGLV